MRKKTQADAPDPVEPAAAGVEAPAPKVEYPKYLRRRDEDGQPIDEVLVQNAAEHAAYGDEWGS